LHSSALSTRNDERKDRKENKAMETDSFSSKYKLSEVATHIERRTQSLEGTEKMEISESIIALPYQCGREKSAKFPF
jgi:hypothetical protein